MCRGWTCLIEQRFPLEKKIEDKFFESHLCTLCGRFLNSVKFWNQTENSIFKKIRNSRRKVSLVIHPANTWWTSAWVRALNWGQQKTREGHQKHRSHFGDFTCHLCVRAAFMKHLYVPDTSLGVETKWWPRVDEVPLPWSLNSNGKRQKNKQGSNIIENKYICKFSENKEHQTG